MAAKFTSGVDLNNQKGINVANGSVSTDAATYGQLLNLVNGKDYKDGVVAASTANVNIAAPGTTLDGVTLATNDRILLKDQTTASQNGIWLFNGSAAALTRPADFPTGSGGLVSQGATVVVDGGATEQAQQWTLTTTGAINVDTTAQTWTRTTAAGTSPTAGNGINVAGTAVSVKLPGSGVIGLIVDGTGVYIDVSLVTRHMAATIGDGSATSIDVVHNFGTKDVDVSVMEVATNSPVIADWTAPTTAKITLTFPAAPTSNQYRVTVMG